MDDNKCLDFATSRHVFMMEAKKVDETFVFEPVEQVLSIGQFDG